MTGDLTINKSAPAISLRDSRYTVGTAPSSAIWGPRYYTKDSANTTVAYFGGIAATDNRTGVQLETVRTVSGSSVFNGLAMYINASGTRSVALSAPDAWRSALGMGFYRSYNANIGNHNGSGTTWSQVYASSNVTMPAGTYLVGLSLPLSTSKNTSGARLRIGTTDLIDIVTNAYSPQGAGGGAYSGVSQPTVFGFATLSSAVTGTINIVCQSQASDVTWSLLGYNKTAYFIMRVY